MSYQYDTKNKKSNGNVFITEQLGVNVKPRRGELLWTKYTTGWIMVGQRKGPITSRKNQQNKPNKNFSENEKEYVFENPLIVDFLFLC